MIDASSLSGLMSNSLSSYEKPTQSDTTAASPSVSRATAAPSASQNYAYGEYSLSERFSQSQTFDLNLKTQDGDSVSLSFSFAESYSMSVGASVGSSQSANGSSRYAAVAASESYAMEQGWQIAVEGELDDEELAAIDQLLKDMTHIANDFFSGDVQAAFNSASEFELDRTELASMDMTLTQTQQYAAAYSAVEGYSQNGNSGQSASSRLDNMLAQLESQKSNDSLSFVDNLLELQKSLIENLVTQDSRYTNDETSTKGEEAAETNSLETNLHQFLSMIE